MLHGGVPPAGVAQTKSINFVKGHRANMQRRDGGKAEARSRDKNLTTAKQTTFGSCGSGKCWSRARSATSGNQAMDARPWHLWFPIDLPDDLFPTTVGTAVEGRGVGARLSASATEWQNLIHSPRQLKLLVYEIRVSLLIPDIAPGQSSFLHHVSSGHDTGIRKRIFARGRITIKQC
jgi:hypothetical protein